MRIGFSTGSLALNDFRKGLKIASSESATAIELSALREEELDPLLNSLDSLESELKRFEYVSFHAPSRLNKLSEADCVKKLRKVADRGWKIILHPDVIHDFAEWRSLGSAVCIENMDRRKNTGSTAAQLRRVFDELPDATFCFDIGHARQVDPTMQEAWVFLHCFRDRLRQVHMSFVNSRSQHERLNFFCYVAFRRVASLISKDVPVILETPVSAETAEQEVRMAESILQSPRADETRMRNGEKGLVK